MGGGGGGDDDDRRTQNACLSYKLTCERLRGVKTIDKFKQFTRLCWIGLKCVTISYMYNKCVL